MKKALPILFLAVCTACTSVPVPVLVDIPAGSFMMGSENPPMPEWDEAPLHEVSLPAFRMSATEITNAQYEAFDPAHKSLRGYEGFSLADDEAVIMVSWDDAMAYCEWLSRKTGRSFRLPTEEEWEYACRAGSTTAYNTGDTYPEEFWKVQENTRFKEPVSLQVAQFEPNSWGLYDLHGNVEEWCYDWYEPYCHSELTCHSERSEESPSYRVVRGGSHNTPVRFLRSANRSGSIPEDRSVLLGFRIVEGDAPSTQMTQSVLESPKMGGSSTKWASPVLESFFAEPIPYVVAPVDGTPFYSHNHQPAVTWLPEGGLLAIWFSTDAEAGREMVVLQSVFDGKAWSPATLFCKVPDRNMTGSALLTLENGEILHFQGVGDAGEWKDLALAMRKTDGPQTWTPLRYIEPEHRVRHQVIAGPIVTADGRILLCCDAGPDGEAGTSLHVSKDGGTTWEDTGSIIKGIHAGIVELKDGRLMAFGRGNAIDGKMPCSISADGGYTWEYSATGFPPIGSGQRLILKRLQEGPLMLCSFGPDGLFVALSYDEGESWPVKKLLTDGKKRVLDGGAWTGTFTLDATHAEPKGYLACTQSPDGVIHLLSSRVHYSFNLAWIEGK
ncbi:MAG: SUMF1/EgtB/PvdO family nonheme iron enzyme [Bacteroidales bacterium]|nr:SUMF1/EgtB/PvdO family nonheme iron enzyme [Bacteroidales bacterium]